VYEYLVAFILAACSSILILLEVIAHTVEERDAVCSGRHLPMFLRNIGKRLPDCTASNLRRQYLSGLIVNISLMCYCRSQMFKLLLVSEDRIL
jgi:hypothetical protein